MIGGKYFRLQTPDTWICPPSAKWLLQNVRSKVLCSICHRVLPGRYPEPIDVEYSRPIQGYHILETSATGIALIDVRLAQVLEPWLTDVAVGKAIGIQKQIESHATIYMDPPQTIRPRQKPPRKVTVCAECGTIREYPRSEDPDYLLSYDIRGRLGVLDRIGRIYVSPRAAEELSVQELRPLRLEPIEVLDAPLDGLRFPNDPSWVDGWDASFSWDPERDGPRPDYPGDI